MLGDGYLLHPLGVCVGHAHEYMRCRGYNFWSGVGSDIGELTLATGVFSGILLFVKHHNCHEHRCWRLSWHVDANDHPVCKVHSVEHPAQAGWLARTITRLRKPHNGYHAHHNA